MRHMILASDVEQRGRALKKLLPFQRKDFQGLFRAMDGRPVTIRLLDPPLHEFLPHDEAHRAELTPTLSVSTEYIIERMKALYEENPMLGCRGSPVRHSASRNNRNAGASDFLKQLFRCKRANVQ